jgi:protein SCO1/2
MAQRRRSDGPTVVLRKILIGGLALFALIVALAVYAVMTPRNSDQKTSLTELGMPFMLASSKGGDVDSRTLIGKPYAMFFGFTHCPEVCPTTLYEMSKSLDDLGSTADGFRVFFVTVDPERDTVDSLRDYLSNFDERMEGLLPTIEQLPKLAAAYRIYYAKVPTSDGSYTMDHSALVYLFDKEGRYAGIIPYGASAETRDEKLKQLLASN